MRSGGRSRDVMGPSRSERGGRLRPLGCLLRLCLGCAVEQVQGNVCFLACQVMVLLLRNRRWLVRRLEWDCGCRKELELGNSGGQMVVDSLTFHVGCCCLKARGNRAIFHPKQVL